MNTTRNTEEHISALLDGELSGPELESTLASLHSDAGRARWADYHQVGDALRSDDLAFSTSADFMQRFSARLEAEPTIIAPAALSTANAKPAPRMYRALWPAMAATFALVFFGVLSSRTPDQSDIGTSVASQPSSVQQDGQVSLAPADGDAAARMQVVTYGKEQILRDPVMDQYLMAHQRVSPSFSPSFYGAAQVARPAPVAVSVDR